MKQNKSALVAFIASFLFAIGLGISGMTQPKYIVGFLDIVGEWKPHLLFVMAGAIFVYAPMQKFFSKQKPLLAEKYFLPTKNMLDRNLIAGAAMFGIGWGLGGYCPGPALTSIPSFTLEPLIFVATLLTGIKIFQVLKARGLLQ